MQFSAVLNIFIVKTQLLYTESLFIKMANFSERLFFVKTIQTVKIWLKIFTVIIYVYQPMKGRFTFMELKVINWNGLKKAQTAFIIKYLYGIKIPQLFIWFDRERKYKSDLIWIFNLIFFPF